ncbi:MAG: 23S rRNA (pseudouridine(1915)-N(3))-methyltransferase RlmH [Clostridia bacterium]|jgi:23S rRNA (pseudouridine1915-N3)-methyltransferase|nr:23S rRNA (pseudouridine(1915)-N(3))-methyltransferase RlmH [Clostridia bacterium]
MYKINIVCVGKIKEEFYRAAVAEYLKRLSRFAKVEICELAEGKNIEEEAPAILRAAKGSIFALCIEGKKLSSPALAAEIKRVCDRRGEMTFIIGSSCGLAQTVKDAADFKLSFSDMTFPHQLMRVILCEQIYRAFMINAGSDYHK